MICGVTFPLTIFVWCLPNPSDLWGNHPVTSGFLIRCNLLKIVGTVEGKYSKQKHLIDDLLAPYDEEGESTCLNELFDKEKFLIYHNPQIM